MASFTITAANSRFETSKIAFNDQATPGADTLTIQEDGYLLALNSNLAARLGGAGAWTVNVHGSIFAQNDHALLLVNDSGPEPTSKITIGATGQIASQNNYAIQSHTSLNISNAGILLAGGSTVIALNGSKGASSVTNTGTIGSTGQLYAVGVGFGTDNITVTNSGTMYGSVNLSSGNDVVTNNGLIDGNIDFGNGNNRYTSTKSTAEVGNITAGSGNDTVSLAGDAGEIGLGNGKNSITITKTGDAEAISTGTGDDTLSILGFVRQVVLVGDGKNSITIGATGTIYNAGASINAILMGNGNDTFSNAGRIDGNVDAGLGDNIGTNKGLIEGYVAFDNGNDKFTNSGTIEGSVYLGNGINSLTNSGTIVGGVFGGANTDTLTNSKLIQGTVDLGDGADVLINSGLILQAVNMGAGNDKVVNTGGILSIDLGAGDDHYTGSNKYGDFVRDSDGLDTIKLGGEDDIYYATGAAAGKDGKDIIDGGAGQDYYWAIDSNSNLRINLDKVEHDFKALLNTGLSLPDNVSQPYSVAGATGIPDTGEDKITGFEHAIGGSGNDRIWGSSVANSLYGNDGNDALIGLGGNDLLYGGKGSDQLIGGAGADELWGGDGSGTDGAVDVFYFLALSDSGTTKATRDRIMDFEDGKDLINLSVIDANTKIAGRQSFDYINDNGQPGQTPQHAAFNKVAGELRSYWTATGQMIEGDVNGDGKADFSIELYDPTHSIVLTSADFILF